MTGLFEPNLDLLETFLLAVGSRELALDDEWGVTTDPPPKSKSVGYEMLASLQPLLVNAFWACVQYKNHTAKFVYACDECRNWVLETTASAKTKCTFCGAKGPRRKIDLPWLGANRYGRPPYPVKGNVTP